MSTVDTVCERSNSPVVHLELFVNAEQKRLAFCQRLAQLANLVLMTDCAQTGILPLHSAPNNRKAVFRSRSDSNNVTTLTAQAVQRCR